MAALCKSEPPGTRRWLVVRPMRRAIRYPLWGAALAGAAASGLLAVRAFQQRQWPSGRWLVKEIQELSTVYVYIGVVGTSALTLLGWRLGRIADAFKELSVADALTGLPNRRLFQARLREELTRRSRYGGNLALLLLDLDGLKLVNDRYGHPCGDEALGMVADSLRKTCRSTDLPARVGGDEFAIIAPQTSAQEACELGDRIRREVSARTVEMGLAPLSISVGVTEAAAMGTVEEAALVAAADRALYAAKASGRNTVSMEGQ